MRTPTIAMTNALISIERKLMADGRSFRRPPGRERHLLAIRHSGSCAIDRWPAFLLGSNDVRLGPSPEVSCKCGASPFSRVLNRPRGGRRPLGWGLEFTGQILARATPRLGRAPSDAYCAGGQCLRAPLGRGAGSSPFLLATRTVG